MPSATGCPHMPVDVDDLAVVFLEHVVQERLQVAVELGLELVIGETHESEKSKFGFVFMQVIHESVYLLNL